MPKQLKLIHFVILLCLFVFASSTYSVASQKDGLLKIHFFDIGQGDSIFIETPSGYQILIDGGPDNKVLSAIGSVMPFSDRDIDMVVASHPHSDHITGLMGVLDRYRVENIVEAKESYDSPQFLAWQEAVAGESAKETEPVIGKQINFDDGVVLYLLHPFQSVAGTEESNPHNDVVVMMLWYGSLRVLLTGDMEARVENKLILAGVDLDADVLKVAHHGSKTSTTEDFLNKVTPQVGIIQVGAENKYGHPSAEVLERLGNYDIKVYRNDLNGDIKLISDGTDYLISSEK